MRPQPRLHRAVAAVSLALPLLASCSSEEPAPDPGHVPTALTAFDPAGVVLERDDFCARFSDEAVEASVGALRTTEHYGNGDAAELTDDLKDVSHEYNCTFVGADGRVARAWVFVPRVPPARAKALVADARKARTGCTPNAGGGFGSPAVGSVCRTEDGSRATYAGLFVDAWLSCSLTVPDPKAPAPELRRSAGEWCVEAAKAASAPSGG